MTPRGLLTVLLFGSPTLGADVERCDARVLNVLFEDQYLAENVRDVCSRSATLPPDDRYEFLADWALPTDAHLFRPDVDFTPTYPAPAIADGPVDSGPRVPTGGDIIAPALDLIDTAASLGRLEELRHRVDATMTDDVRSQVDRLALLTLIDMARDDLTSAQALLAEVFELALSEEVPAASRIDSLLLCIHRAAESPSLCQSIVDPTYQFTRTYQSIVDRTAWQRQFSAAYSRVRHVAEREKEGGAYDVDPTDLARWNAASLPRARRRGAGVPVAHWFTASGYAENLSSHDEDLLYYASPLRGDFEVECDIAMFGWHESEVFIAGKWVRSVHDHRTYKVGGFTGLEGLYALDPPLTKGEESIHFRSVVRNGVVTTYVHGRRIHVRPLSAEHDPWLALHSAPRHDGAVRNLRVTGDPVIPDELLLTADPELVGWISYFDEQVGVDWRNRGGEVHAARRFELPPGCHQESALFYHRPMLEDGSIEYEFWYDARACAAHPVLDRLCFILDPDGIKVHWLTDGLYDRTGLPPDNLINEQDNQHPLPLNAQAWNQLRLTVRGDTVDLLLNGELVYQRELEPTNQRHFGLFHYADRTELRVRNVVWRGDWPRELPELDAQQLVIDETGFLDKRLPELADVFSHDFVADGLPLDRFAIIQGDIPAHISIGPDGLLMMRQGFGDGYITANIAPNLTVRGDFDITASFDQLVTDAAGDDGSSNIYLRVATDAGDECLLMRRRTLRGRDQQVVQCQRVLREGDETRRRFFDHQPMEARAGTLRLARRGEMVYYLFAENDSRQFRLIGQEPFPADDLSLQGVQIILQTHGEGGSTSVVWKDLTIRAEALLGPAIDNPARLLLNLNGDQ